MAIFRGFFIVSSYFFFLLKANRFIDACENVAEIVVNEIFAFQILTETYSFGRKTLICHLSLTLFPTKNRRRLK